MVSRLLPRRVGVFAAAFGVTALVGTTPALAVTKVPGENIYGSGSSLQKILQQNILTPKWESTPADHATLSNSVTASYFSSSSGSGLAEFGNTTGALNLAEDPVADNGSGNGYGQPVLDAYVGTDDAPTGPLSDPTSNLGEASAAATGSAATPIDELTIPVAQAPVAVLLSVPLGIQIGNATTPNAVVHLLSVYLQQVWNQTLPAELASKTEVAYPANSWGSLLERAGLKEVASNPTATQFTDAGGATGGDQLIELQARSSGSGTTYAFRGELYLTGDAFYPASQVTDANTGWPVTVNETGNTGGAQLVENTELTPGSIGYANLADAALATTPYSPFTAKATFTSEGGTHQILFAEVQDNQGSTPARYANPESSVGHANVYTGAQINVNNAYSLTQTDGVGQWTVPGSGTPFVFDPTGSWGGTAPGNGTLASDPDIYDHSGDNGGTKAASYPIVSADLDLAWSTYDEAGSNLVGDFGSTAADATDAGNTISSFLIYATGTHGQADAAAGGDYYARLPTVIDSDAIKAADAITP
jgi:hypothetical protein